MTTLITAAEVIEMAFAAQPGMDEGAIPASTIVAAQEKFIAPALNGLYHRLDAPKYAGLLNDCIKPALACYVKFLVLPDIAAPAGNLGVVQARGAGFAPAGERTLADMRKRTRATANMLLRAAIAHLEADPAAYPEYDPRDNVLGRVSITSQIVL